jgi:SAM-dependent methyltransferase
MELDDLKKNWDQLGKKDAFWAILTGSAGAARDWDLGKFFAEGVGEIEARLKRLGELGIVIERGNALDFGCGVGRLTQALARAFDHATGVDIAPSMIEKAEALNAMGERCRYVLNERDDLTQFADGTFDFVYSNITLQHMEPRYSTRYIGELVRVARPGGAIVFQVPSTPRPGPAPQQTADDRTLPKSARQARIEPEVSALRCAPATRFPVVALVTNTGNRMWPARGGPGYDRQVHVGNHWLDARRKVLKLDDVRAELPRDIAPGSSCEFGFWFTSPDTPGQYFVEIDLVQEYVSWFGKNGSPTALIEITVDASLPPGRVEGLPAKMEMYGVPRDEVETLLRDAGAELVAVDDDDSPGPEWISYRYYARKAGA